MSGGWRHTLTLKRDGSLWAWGLNNYGQLGNGDTRDVGFRVLKGDAHVGVYGEQFRNGSKAPVRVAGEEEWAEVCAQGHHSIGMKRDGSVWTWGAELVGQLGIGSTENQAVPVRWCWGESSRSARVLRMARCHPISRQERGRVGEVSHASLMRHAHGAPAYDARTRGGRVLRWDVDIAWAWHPTYAAVGASRRTLPCDTMKSYPTDYLRVRRLYLLRRPLASALERTVSS